MAAGSIPCAAAHVASSPTSAPYARRVRSADPRRCRSRSKRRRAVAQTSPAVPTVGPGARRCPDPRSGPLGWPGVAVFFIDTSTGQVATQRQLVEAGIAPSDQPPPKPWHRIQGTGDATTLWYAVMRKQVREGVFI